ncbi:hypothetical protein IQ243_28515 [Nostocales cyanobacterium LEGE 11386]|nr:hypothetical protein [Nostocales cyanobacterium LEGE 11386]
MSALWSTTTSFRANQKAIAHRPKFAIAFIFITETTIMPQATTTVTPAKEVQELTVVEISFYDHEIRAGQKLIASISYDHADFVTQPWLVMVNGEEIHRADTWAKCHNFITWHYTQGTLPVQQPFAPSTTGNEIKADIANECEKFGFELLDNGIYHHDVKLGEVGCTDGQWWFIPASSVHQQKVPCNSAFDAVLSLSIDEAASCEELLDKPFDQLTAEEWRILLEYEPVPESRELVVA